MTQQHKQTRIPDTFWRDLRDNPRFPRGKAVVIQGWATLLQRLGYNVMLPPDAEEFRKRALEDCVPGRKLRGQRDTWRMFWPSDPPADMTPEQVEEYIELFNLVHRTKRARRLYQRRRTAINRLEWFGFTVTPPPTDGILAQRIREYLETDHRRKQPTMNAGGASDE